MNLPPLLTDRTALALHRTRALRQGFESFWHDEAAAEVQERLLEVNRAFMAPAVITAYPAPWQAILPGARIIGDDERLDLAPGAHDLVIHALALHWANDPVGQLVQARLALKPDGLFLAITPGGQTLAELRSVLAEAESRLRGGLSPRVLPMAEIRDWGALMQRAGFALPVADALPRRLEYRDLAHLVAELRAMGETNALAQRHRGPGAALGRAVLAEAQRLYAEAFPGDAGRIRATLELIYLTGWAPHDSQQKPLRPGSAQMLLADALRQAQEGGPKASPDSRDAMPGPKARP